MNTTRVQVRLGLDDLRQDAVVCLRGLLRARTLTATIVLTVGLSIGLTTALFGAVFGILVRPLPYQVPDRLFRLYTDSPPNLYNFSVADYLTLDREQTQFERVAGYVDRAMIFTSRSGSDLVQGRVVTWTYFDLLGIRPALGRGFTIDDSRPPSPPAAIVSHAFWSERLGGRTDALGAPVIFIGNIRPVLRRCAKPRRSV